MFFCRDLVEAKQWEKEGAAGGPAWADDRWRLQRWVKLESWDFGQEKKGCVSPLGYEFTKLLLCCNRQRKDQVAVKLELRARRP